MAIDLSNIIKETIEATLETNLSFETPVNEILKTTKDSLLDKNLVIIESNFKFNSVEANFKFIFPAYTSSFIFNKIMMEEGEPSLEVDDDIADAIKEISSQISGSLETAINAKDDEELGACKFEIGNLSLDTSGNYDDVNNLIKFNLKLEDKNSDIYISFNDEFLPYIEILCNSEDEIINITENTENEDKPSEENNDGEDDNIINDDESEQSNTDENENIEDKDKPLEEDSQNEDDNDSKNKKESEDIIEEEVDEEEIKNKKLKKLIIIFASLLVLIIIVFLVLFFIGTFDKQEPTATNINKPKLSKRELLLKDLKNKDINFSTDLINIKKLNKRLSLLTKYEILELDVLNKYKKLEKERLYKLKMKKLEEFAVQNQEEKLFKKDLLINKKKENRFEDKKTDLNISKQDIDKNLRLTFIQLDALKYKEYKNTITKEITKTTNISICKDKFGKTYIYIGPMYLNLVVNNLMNSIKNANAKLINITNTQFDKRCSF